MGTDDSWLSRRYLTDLQTLLMGVIGFDIVYGSTEDDTLGSVTAIKVTANEEFVEDFDLSNLMGNDAPAFDTQVAMAA